MEKRSQALPHRLEPGDCFAGKYQVERMLGSGGMSVVFAALHQGLRQKVAIKLVTGPNELPAEAVSRFLREARAAAALRSEYTARVVDVDVDECGRHYIVMEHLDGEDLGDVLRRTLALPIETAVGYVLHACEAMAEAHSLGIIHRDLKPQNLFLTWRIDGTPQVKVLDFGVSKVLAGEAPSVTSSSLSAPNVLLGTPHYMAPEQIRTPADIDGRCDVWALGVTLFELLTHEEPFAGATLPDVIAAVLQNAPRSPIGVRPEIPEALAAVLLACLEKDVNRRIPNVGSLARALRPWAPVWALDAAARAERICGADAALSTDTHAQRSAEPGAWAVPREGAASTRIARAPRGSRMSLRHAFYLAGAVAATSSIVAWGAVILRSPAPTASGVSRGVAAPLSKPRVATASDSAAHAAVPAASGLAVAEPLARIVPSSGGAIDTVVGVPVLDPATPNAPPRASADTARKGSKSPTGTAPPKSRVSAAPAATAPRKATIVRVAKDASRPFPADPLVGRR